MFIYSAITWTNPKYGDVEYPDWAIAIGWFLAAVSVGMIPLVFVFVVLKKLFTGVSFRRAGLCVRLATPSTFSRVRGVDEGNE